MGKLLFSLTGLLPAMACASESFGGEERKRAQGGRVCVSKMCCFAAVRLPALWARCWCAFLLCRGR